MQNEHQPERRKHERIPFREDILIDGTRMSTSMDISEDGLYISAMQAYEENSFIEVTIPFKEEKLTVKAQVRHCQPGIGMGVMFIDLNDEQKAKIQELMTGITNKTARSDGGAKNILLVEDNATTRQAIQSALSKEGFCVIEANDGIEAMKFIAERNLDLVVLDLYMKGIDGLKVLSVLKANPKWKNLPVIVCSAHDTQDVKERVLNAGAEEFLSKRGTSPSKLAQSVKSVLQRYQKS
jgi:CheY-like chemotaxis protein